MSKLLQDKDLNLIQRYFDFDLTEEEALSFNNRLDEDTDFAQEVENYNYSYHTINRIIEDNQAKMPDSDQEGNTTETSGASNNIFKWMAVVLGIILLSATAYFLLGQGESAADTERVYAQVESYVDSMTDDYLLRGGGNGITLTEEKAELKKIMEQYDESNPTNILSELEGFISKVQNPSNLEMALWAKVRIHTKSNDWENTQKTLKEISKNDDFNSSKKAKKILGM